MRQRPPDILSPQLAIETDGGVDLLHHHRWTGSESRAPLWVGGLVPLVRRLAQACFPMKVWLSRRHLLAAAGTLAAGLFARKPRAQELEDLAGALKLTEPPVTAPAISFVAADGTEHHLADFLGHGMVVNLWATWCAPCVAEMPSLAALSKTLAPNDIAVLPLSSDRGGATVVEAFYSQHGITGLPVLLDPKGAAAHAWHARGIPTSLIIDKQGRERARLEGSADWSTPAAAALVRKLT
jgi:thiol-disulfide isomerase/thioredoxin